MPLLAAISLMTSVSALACQVAQPRQLLLRLPNQARNMVAESIDWVWSTSLPRQAQYFLLRGYNTPLDDEKSDLHAALDDEMKDHSGEGPLDSWLHSIQMLYTNASDEFVVNKANLPI